VGDEQRIVSATGIISAPADAVFEEIADPSRQPAWDGNDNLGHADPGQRVHAVGEMFVMTNAQGAVRHNHIVEFEEGRLIAWLPSEVGKQPPGHLWRWELRPLEDGRTEVVHTYDWTNLTDSNRLPRARATTSEKLQASIDRLAARFE
jgi:uncharacterized protein YndB with AHSA1/START domain